MTFATASFLLVVSASNRNGADFYLAIVTQKPKWNSDNLLKLINDEIKSNLKWTLAEVDHYKSSQNYRQFSFKFDINCILTNNYICDLDLVTFD